MNILVLNGSPKGEYSITLQTCKYLEKLYPQYDFNYVNVGKDIKKLEKDITLVLGDIKKADLIIFAYPVYTFLAPYQLHRFIEILKQSGISLEGKFVTQISTSKRFYDVTAHKYISENCFDMGMKYINGLSADMDDLPTEKGQKQARDFFDFVMWSVENDLYEKDFIKRTPPKKIDVSVSGEERESKTGDVVVVTNCEKEDSQLESMINLFSCTVKYNVRVVNINEYPFKGGCLGCLKCAADGKCVYKDGFDDFLRNNIQNAQAIIYAFTIKDHSMGASFKLYDDRQFCNGHRSVTMGMPVGYIVSGNYSEETNLQLITQARAGVGGNFLAGVATDEYNPDEEIRKLVLSLEYALDNSYVPPQNFYGVGGTKIFRDLIWTMQGFMKADHKFYKAHKQYDFPQKNRGMMILSYLLGMAMSNPKIKAKMGNKMNEGMLMPYKKILDDIDKKKS